MQNIGGSIGGALAPLVTGLVVQHTGGYTPAFLVGGVAALVSACAYTFVRADAYASLRRSGRA